MEARSDQSFALKKRVIVLVFACLLIVGFTFLGGVCMRVESLWVKIFLLAGANLCNGAVALVAMRITGIRADLDWKNLRQFLIGAIIALGLSLLIAFVPALCGFSLVGEHKKFTWFGLVYNLLNYFLIIGPVEELVFRVYVQETMISFFPKRPIVGVILAAVTFGLFHLINGSPIQGLFTFGIGLVFGVCKYRVKNCKYLGISFCHGLYDFLNEIVRLFVV